VTVISAVAKTFRRKTKMMSISLKLKTSIN